MYEPEYGQRACKDGERQRRMRIERGHTSTTCNHLACNYIPVRSQCYSHTRACHPRFQLSRHTHAHGVILLYRYNIMLTYSWRQRYTYNAV